MSVETVGVRVSDRVLNSHQLVIAQAEGYIAAAKLMIEGGEVEPIKLGQVCQLILEEDELKPIISTIENVEKSK